MTAEALWDLWRNSMKRHARITLRLSPNSLELMKVMEITERVEDDAELTQIVERFFTLTPKEQQQHSIGALTVGFLNMALPKLMAEHVSEQAEGQKFLDRLNTYR